MAFLPGVESDGDRDDHLPLLTRAQARRVRMLVRQAMAERGREVVMSGGYVRDDHGTVFGSRNIAAVCRNDPVRVCWRSSRPPERRPAADGTAQRRQADTAVPYTIQTGHPEPGAPGSISNLAWARGRPAPQAG
jgi:hypothetical protein